MGDAINDALEKIPNRAIYIFLLSAAIICIIFAARYWDVFPGVSGIFLLFVLIIILVLYNVFREAGANGDTHGDNLTQNEMRYKVTLGDDEMTQKQMREHNKELEAFKKKVDEHNKEVLALKEEVDDICLGLEDVAGVFADLGDAQGLRLLRDALVDVLNGAIDAADKRRAELRK
jgi:hypothetical protein